MFQLSQPSPRSSVRKKKKKKVVKVQPAKEEEEEKRRPNLFLKYHHRLAVGFWQQRDPRSMIRNGKGQQPIRIIEKKRGKEAATPDNPGQGPKTLDSPLGHRDRNII